MTTGRGGREPDPNRRDERATPPPAASGTQKPKKKPTEPNVEQQVERMENEGGPPGVKDGGSTPSSTCGESP